MNRIELLMLFIGHRYNTLLIKVLIVFRRRVARRFFCLHLPPALSRKPAILVLILILLWSLLVLIAISPETVDALSCVL